MEIVLLTYSVFLLPFPSSSTMIIVIIRAIFLV